MFYCDESPKSLYIQVYAIIYGKNKISKGKNRVNR